MAQLEKELQSPAPQETVDGETEAKGTGRKRRVNAPPTGEMLKQLSALQSNAEGLENAAGRRIGGIGPIGDVVRGIVDSASRSEAVDGDESGEEQALKVGESVKENDAAELDRRLDVLEKRIGTGTVDEVRPPTYHFSSLLTGFCRPRSISPSYNHSKNSKTSSASSPNRASSTPPQGRSSSSSRTSGKRRPSLPVHRRRVYGALLPVRRP